MRERHTFSGGLFFPLPLSPFSSLILLISSSRKISLHSLCNYHSVFLLEVNVSIKRIVFPSILYLSLSLSLCLNRNEKMDKKCFLLFSIFISLSENFPLTRVSQRTELESESSNERVEMKRTERKGLDLIHWIEQTSSFGKKSFVSKKNELISFAPLLFIRCSSQPLSLSLSFYQFIHQQQF